ncbi:hypothetical protein ACFW2V_02770 [Streptomyces sp. NPDC058947]|uniref:hypothetical protein n=1 Tax=Streptomyces sp. NPDC058947 TaxID=3346675 RepID=UPI0036CE97E1
MTERERQELLRAKAEEIVQGLPAWDGESPAVLVTVSDPVTQRRLGHWFTPATAAPQPEARVRHLRAVPECAS